MKTLNEIAENYFNTLNPIAERISTDIIAIKGAYEELWNCLSIKEKNQILNETVVHPEAVLKYTLSSKSYSGADLDFPLITPQITGSKYTVDEATGVSWRDEHSAPFSWKTPSQIDLSIFSSPKVDINSKSDHSFFISDRPQINQEFIESFEVDKNSDSKKQDNSWSKRFITEKSDTSKNNATTQSQNVVLVGTCSKLSGLYSKLKFLPGKSYSYEVQTVVTNSTISSDGSFLEKIKTSAVNKFQNTFKFVGCKNLSEKKLTDIKESKAIIQSKGGATVIKLQKPSPKIAKPKSPPPPPPVDKQPEKQEEMDSNKTGKNLIFVKKPANEKSTHYEIDSEKATLLEENSVQSFLSGDPDSLEQELQSKVVFELSDDLNSVSTECTPLSGPCIDTIPKSGFDFLDNW